MPLEKPGTPEDLIHFGVKGMRWGIRKAESSESSISSGSENKGMSIKKKVAIGGAIVVGAAVAGVILQKTGHLPASPLSNRHPADIERLLAKDPNAKVSHREMKRYARMAVSTNEWRTRMRSMERQAVLNAARAKLPDQYVRDASGNYVPILFRKPGA